MGDVEVKLAKQEAIKRFRNAVRLEMSIAGDYIIGRQVQALNELMDKEIAEGGLPALDRGIGSLAKKVADQLAPVLEGVLDRLLIEESGPRGLEE